VGGEAGWAGPLAPEACRRLACDGALTRVVVTRHHNHHQPGGQHPDSRSVDHDHGSNRSRVVQPTQHSALAVRDGGCVFPGCDRPLAWCEAHHLLHWLNGGPTDLANLAMLCRAHHRAVHEGGWQLARAPDGRFTATPPHRRHRPAASLGRPCRMRAGGSAG
jgi:hypothetical protein